MAEEKEEKKPKILPLLYFEKQGLSIRPWMIHSIEKRVEYSGGAFELHRSFQIVINAGMEPSADMPVGEKILHFEDEEERDDKYELILMTLEELNNKVIRL